MDKLFLFAFVLQFGLLIAQETKLSAELRQKLQNDSKLRINVIVSFKNGVSSTIASAKPKATGNRGQQNTGIVNALKKNADESQASVIEMLAKTPNLSFAYYRKYWLSNILYIHEADAETINTIAKDSQVSEVQIAPDLKIEETIVEKEAEVTSRSNNDILNSIQALEARTIVGVSSPEELRDPVFVATIDTGVRWTHTYLRNKFGGWHDGVNGNSTPYDLDGHGTFAFGCAAGKRSGSEFLGPVPDYTRWMACLACVSRNKCHFEHVMNCLTWVACPYKGNSSSTTACSRTPNVLSMSITGQRDDYGFDLEFESLRELGVIPVVSVGGRGPNCGTTVSPGQSQNAISVGSIYTGDLDLLYVNTSIGPTLNGSIKPDLVVPVHRVLSAGIADDNALTVWSGTSLAVPFVAGTVALMVTVHPDLSFEDARRILTQTSNKDVRLQPIHEKSCTEKPNLTIPNNYFGFGKLNVASAVSETLDEFILRRSRKH